MQKNRFQKIKNYLLGNGNTLVILVLLLAFSMLLNGLISAPLIKRGAQLKSFNDWRYNYVYYTKKVCDKFDNYVNLENTVSLHSREHTQFESCNCSINCIKIMQVEDSDYSIGMNLAFGEIAISKNIAQKYGLNVGDTVYCNADYSSKFISYILIEVFDYPYGISDVNFRNDLGLVVLGYDSKMVHEQTKYLWLSQNEQREYFANNVGTLLSVDNIATDKASCWLSILGFIILATIMQVVLLGGYHRFVSKQYLRRLKKSKLYGENLKIIRRLIFTLMAVPSGLELVFSVLVVVLLNMSAGLYLLIPIAAVCVQIFISLAAYYLYFKFKLKV